MKQTIAVGNDLFKELATCNLPRICASHIFQDATPATDSSKTNSVGGSSVVPARQVVNWQEDKVPAFLVSPSANPAQASAECRVPALVIPFHGDTMTDHDEWFHRSHRDFLLDLFSEHLKTESKHKFADILYSHMPVSGNAAQDFANQNGNPHVYLGHAWELISIQNFPARHLKPIRLREEYRMVKEANLIITNTEWEREAIANLYSRRPSFKALGVAIDSGINSGQLESNFDKNAFFEAMRVTSDFIRSDFGYLTRESILAKTIANPLGVETKWFCPENVEKYQNFTREKFFSEHNIPENAIIFGSVGRIAPQKDPIKAIEIFAEAVSKAGNPKNWYLVLVGPYQTNEYGHPAGYAKLTKDFIKNNYPEISTQVLMPGAMSPLEANSLFHFGIESSRFETWGLSFQERLACGVPTVAIPNPVYEELYMDSGLIFSQNTSHLASELVSLATNPGRAKHYADQCLDAGRRYDWKKSSSVLAHEFKTRFQ